MRRLRYRKLSLGRQAFLDNPVLQIQYEDSDGEHCIDISGGVSDRFQVFQESCNLLVLKTNHRFCYVRLIIYKRFQRVAEIELEGKKRVKRCLGKEGLRLSPLPSPLFKW